MGVAQLKFVDQEDGTMAIEASHDGEFEPLNQSHACLRAVAQFLPEVVMPAGTRVEGDIGTRLPINDIERYQALKQLSLMEASKAEAIADFITPEGGIQSEADFDKSTDMLVGIIRGQKAEPQKVED